MLWTLIGPVVLVGIFALALIPAFALIWLAFRPPPRVIVPIRPHWTRWLWYAFQAAIFLATLQLMSSLRTPDETFSYAPGIMSAIFAFYLTFLVSFYWGAAKRLGRLAQRVVLVLLPRERAQERAGIEYVVERRREQRAGESRRLGGYTPDAHR
jgi:hypothetical protein